MPHIPEDIAERVRSGERITVHIITQSQGIAANVLRWGTGALNIDATRIGHDEPLGKPSTGMAGKRAGIMGEPVLRHRENTGPGAQGRWPANLLLSDDAAALLDEMSGERKSGTHVRSKGKSVNCYGQYNESFYQGIDTTGGASRFFLRVAPDADEPLRFLYCGKASKRDRSSDGTVNNTHSTVKPQKLMSWLVRLCTPPGGTILDPFLGSGTTGVAAVLEGFNFVGIEKEAEYLAIARARIEHARRSIVQPMLELS